MVFIRKTFESYDSVTSVNKAFMASYSFRDAVICDHRELSMTVKNSNGEEILYWTLKFDPSDELSVDVMKTISTKIGVLKNLIESDTDSVTLPNTVEELINL